jgi:cytochrome c-type biogenesis protein CcmH
MTLFWLLATLVAIFVAAMVVLPLWRVPPAHEQNMVALNRRVFHERMAELEKDQAEGRIDVETLAELSTELQRNLLTLDRQSQASSPETPRRLITALTFILLPILALGFYHFAVQPKGLADWWSLKQGMGPTVDRMLQGQAPTEEESAGRTLADFVRILQSRLQLHPDNAEGWFLLGVSYVQMEMAQPAQVAFERAYHLDPAQPRYELAYAQTRIFSNDGQLDSVSRQLLDDVLQKAPAHEGALLLLGLGAYRSGDYSTAVTTLEKLQQVRSQRQVSDNPAAMRSVAETLAAARAQLHLAQTHQTPVTGAAAIRVKVQIDRSLAGKFQPDDVLYVFARALNGPPMPLAVIKRRAADLPLTLSLDDSQSMMPSHPLSSVPEIMVTARISRHGSPDPQPGDIEAIAVPLRQNGQAQSVDLLLQSVRP